jgi:hypothetical protein
VADMDHNYGRAALLDSDVALQAQAHSPSLPSLRCPRMAERGGFLSEFMDAWRLVGMARGVPVAFVGSGSEAKTR